MNSTMQSSDGWAGGEAFRRCCALYSFTRFAGLPASISVQVIPVRMMPSLGVSSFDWPLP